MQTFQGLRAPGLLQVFVVFLLVSLSHDDRVFTLKWDTPHTEREINKQEAILEALKENMLIYNNSINKSSFITNSTNVLLKQAGTVPVSKSQNVDVFKDADLFPTTNALISLDINKLQLFAAWIRRKLDVDEV